MADDIRNDDPRDDAVQHGIDDNPHDDGKKGLGLGALGGGTVGAIAGMAAGPLGAVIGAAIGGTVGSLASGAAVDAVDSLDNDNTVTGIGSSSTRDVENSTYNRDVARTTTMNNNESLRTDNDRDAVVDTNSTYTDQSYGSGTLPISTAASGEAHNDAGGHNIVTGDESDSNAGETGLASGAIAGGLIGTAVGGPVGAVIGGTIGSLAGGVAGDASEAADDGTNRTGGTSGGSGYNTLRSESGQHHTDLMGADYETRPYGTYEGRHISRTDYQQLPETDRQRVQLLEEELHVDKSMRQIGEVEISKRVVEEQVQVPVTLEREEVVVKVHDASGAATGAVGEDQTIVVPVREEFASVSKEVHVTGEVEVEKRMTTEQKTISDTVRREEVEIEGANGRNVRVEDDTNRM